MASDSRDELIGEMWNRLRGWIDDNQVKSKLADALARLPKEPREFALERCYFVAIGDAEREGGYFLSVDHLTAVPETRWLVVLNSAWKDEAFQSAVAHEVAHIWLRHPDADIDPEAHENEAAAQVREWGFSGIGSLPLKERS